MELQRNMKYYDLLFLLPGPVKYYDVQKVFGMCCKEAGGRRSLEFAIDQLDLFTNYSMDVYQNPKKKKDELFLSYPDHDQYVSREFTDRDKIMRDREVTSTKCPICHLPAKRKIRWFMNNSKAYESISLCQKHGYVKGKIRIRHTEEDRYYVIKTLKNVGNEKAEEIREKRDFLRKKRQIKRKSEKQI